MKIPKPTATDRERFQAMVPDDPSVEVNPMFGNLGAFVHGNMFMGLFGADIGLKLAESDRTRLLAEPGTGPFGPVERPMGGYVTIPADWSATTARPWIETALTTARALPVKQPKRTTKPARGNAAEEGARRRRRRHRDRDRPTRRDRVELRRWER